MCRILAIQAARPVDMTPWLAAFAEACRSSKEYQGHGWGVAWREGARWRRYRTTTPIWEDDVEAPESHLALFHARSAFRDEGIVVENNMPFVDEPLAFAFNGELHGVRLSVPGATGAARLLRLLTRFGHTADGDWRAALVRLQAVLHARSTYVRALNIVVSDGVSLFASASHGEDPEYFTMHRGTSADGAVRAICSEPLETSRAEDGAARVGAMAWSPIPNHTTLKVEESVPC